MLFRSPHLNLLERRKRGRPTPQSPSLEGSRRSSGEGEGPEGPRERIWRLEQRCFELLRDLAHLSQLRESSTSEDLARRSTSVQAAINRALHQEGAHVKVQGFFLTREGKYRGSTNPSSCANQLLEHRDTVIRAARSADPGVMGLETRES